MKFGYTSGFGSGEAPRLLSSEIVAGDVFWKDKEGGSMLGRTEYGVHDTALAAWEAAAKSLSAQAEHSDEIARRHADYCLKHREQKPKS